MSDQQAFVVDMAVLVWHSAINMKNSANVTIFCTFLHTHTYIACSKCSSLLCFQLTGKYRYDYEYFLRVLHRQYNYNVSCLSISVAVYDILSVDHPFIEYFSSSLYLSLSLPFHLLDFVPLIILLHSYFYTNRSPFFMCVSVLWSIASVRYLLHRWYEYDCCYCWIVELLLQRNSSHAQYIYIHAQTHMHIYILSVFFYFDRN